MITEKERKHYVRQIRILLPIHTKKERAYFRDLGDSIELFIRSHPEASMSDLTKHFGEPQNIVYQYMESIDMDSIIRHTSMRRMLHRTLIIILLCFLASTAIWFGTVHKAYLDEKNATVKEGTTIYSSSKDEDIQP